MKYTARHIQRFLEQGRIDADLYKSHFPSLLPTQLPACGDCGELKSGACPGGKDPVACLMEKSPKNGQGDHKKRRDPLLGMGAQGPGVRGTALPRDQSKM